jgi:biopolymer transport protein ExbD
MRRSPFERRHRVIAKIPSASMGGIAFLLLIFFTATTIVSPGDGMVQVAATAAEEQPPRERALHVRIDAHGRVAIDERFVASEQIEGMVRRAMTETPGLVVVLNADERVPYRTVAGVLDELRAANAVDVSFAGARPAAAR